MLSGIAALFAACLCSARPPRVRHVVILARRESRKQTRLTTGMVQTAEQWVAALTEASTELIKSLDANRQKKLAVRKFAVQGFA
jgi:hypothetical protein